MAKTTDSKTVKTDPKTARQAIQNLLCCRPVAYYPSLARRVGGARAAVMLSQLLYWQSTKPDKPFYKSSRELEAETGLTGYEQETARKSLLACGAITASRQGWPATWHYQVDLDRLSDLIADPQIRALPESDNTRFWQRQSLVTHDNRFVQNTNLNEGPINELNTENTTENTQEEEGPVLQNFAGISESMMQQIRGLGVYESKIPDVLRAVQDGWTDAALRDLISRCKRDDRRGSPAALFLTRLRELPPPATPVYDYTNNDSDLEAEPETWLTLDDLISQAFVDTLKIPLGGDFDGLMARVAIAGIEPLALVSDTPEDPELNLVLACPKYIWETYIRPHASALIDCLAPARITAITLSE